MLDDKSMVGTAGEHRPSFPPTMFDTVALSACRACVCGHFVSCFVVPRKLALSLYMQAVSWHCDDINDSVSWHFDTICLQ